MDNQLSPQSLGLPLHENPGIIALYQTHIPGILLPHPHHVCIKLHIAVIPSSPSRLSTGQLPEAMNIRPTSAGHFRHLGKLSALGLHDIGLLGSLEQPTSTPAIAFVNTRDVRIVISPLVSTAGSFSSKASHISANSEWSIEFRTHPWR